MGTGTAIAIFTNEDYSMSRGFYGATIAWWMGAFSPETAASSIANLLDCDYSCEVWEITDRGHWVDFRSKSLNMEVTFRVNYGRCSVYIYKDDSGFVATSVSLYDDYLLANACERWLKRNREIKARKKENDSQRLINERITKGYIQTVEMIEKKILNREPETARELQALVSEPPKQPKEVKRVNYVTSTSTSDATNIQFFSGGLRESSSTTGTGSGSAASKK